MDLKWQVEQLRFTWFFTERPSHLLEQRWGALGAGEPDIEIINRQPQFMYRAEKRFGKGWLNLQLDHNLMHIMYSGKQLLADTLVSEAPVAGLFDEEGSKFQNFSLSREDLFSIPSDRLAVGLIVLNRVDDKEEGYRVLDKLITSVRLEPVDGADSFMFQINRPVKGRIANREVPINRVTRWSVAKIAKPQVIPHEKSGIEASARGGDEYWVRLEADINMVPEAVDCILGDEQKDAFSKLMNLANSLAVGRGQI